MVRISQLRIQEVVSPLLKYRDSFEAPLNVKYKDGLGETGRLL